MAERTVLLDRRLSPAPALAVVRSPWGAASGEAVIAGAGTSGLQAAAVAS